MNVMTVQDIRQFIGAKKELASLRLRKVPFPPVAPSLGKRGVFIGASNSAGQGWAWARSLEKARPELEVVSARFGDEDSAAGFDFEVDQPIFSHYAAHSSSWQRQQFAALKNYRALIIESGDSILSRLFRGNTARQAQLLQESGVRVALLFHGSDIRAPDRHMSREAHSHFAADSEFARVFRNTTASNRELIGQLDVPVFVSTPDLLDEVPDSIWLPVVVDVARWDSGRPPFSSDGPLRVVHIPSSSMVKGTELVEPLLLQLANEGVIDYQPIQSIPHSKMPAAYGAADVVIDQFRVGNYGVAACEALAAGRVVVSHVSDRVRELTQQLTGEELPIVEATPETLRDVLEKIHLDPAKYVGLTTRGRAFAREHHDGRRSGEILSDWIGKS